MPKDIISIRGARQHNLKNLDVDLPRNKLIVMTGLSGSGKSSLAFDTIYAEGQRRYVESLSAYARQFIGLMDKPDVDKIEGLSPAISIDQKSASHNPRSTVGTVTEIYDYMRLLWARIGQPHCPVCGKKIQGQTIAAMVEQLLSLKPGSRIILLAPFIKDQKGEHKVIFEQIKKAGFARVRLDGTVMDLNEAQNVNLDKQKKHSIDVVVDRLVIDPADKGRLSESLEKALDLGDGIAMALPFDDKNNAEARPGAPSKDGTPRHAATARRILSFPKNSPVPTAICNWRSWIRGILVSTARTAPVRNARVLATN